MVVRLGAVVFDMRFCSSWRGLAIQGDAWRITAWSGKSGRSAARPGETASGPCLGSIPKAVFSRLGPAWHGPVWPSVSGLGMSWHGFSTDGLRRGSTPRGAFFRGRAWRGSARQGLAGFGLAGHGFLNSDGLRSGWTPEAVFLRPGEAWLGVAGRGEARFF